MQVLFSASSHHGIIHKSSNTVKYAGFQDLISPQGAGRHLSAVLASSDPVVRMRAITLVIGLGGRSEAAVKALQHSGLLSHRHSATWCSQLVQHASASAPAVVLLNGSFLSTRSASYALQHCIQDAQL